MKYIRSLSSQKFIWDGCNLFLLFLLVENTCCQFLKCPCYLSGDWGTYWSDLPETRQSEHSSSMSLVMFPCPLCSSPLECQNIEGQIWEMDIWKGLKHAQRFYHSLLGQTRWPHITAQFYFTEIKLPYWELQFTISVQLNCWPQPIITMLCIEINRHTCGTEWIGRNEPVLL